MSYCAHGTMRIKFLKAEGKKKTKVKGKKYSEFRLSLHEIVGRRTHISFSDQNLVFRNILNAKAVLYFCVVGLLVKCFIRNDFTAVHGNCIR